MKHYDSVGKPIRQPGVLPGNCPICGGMLDNIALGVHRCSGKARCHCGRPIYFEHWLGGKSRFAIGEDTQYPMCSQCRKHYSKCDCEPEIIRV